MQLSSISAWALSAPNAVPTMEPPAAYTFSGAHSAITCSKRGDDLGELNGTSWAIHWL